MTRGILRCDTVPRGRPGRNGVSCAFAKERPEDGAYRSVDVSLVAVGVSNAQFPVESEIAYT